MSWRRNPHEVTAACDQIVAILRDATRPMSAPEIGRSLGWVYLLECTHNGCWSAGDELGPHRVELTFAEHVGPEAEGGCEFDIVARRGTGNPREAYLMPLLRRGVVERIGTGRDTKWRLAPGVSLTEMSAFEDALREDH